MHFGRNTLLSIALSLLLMGCQKKSRFNIHAFENPIEVEIHRFDRDFIALDTTNLIEGFDVLEQKYPAFYPLFLSDVLIMNINDTLANALDIQGFLKDTTFAKVHRDVGIEFEHIGAIEDQLSTAYSYLAHYFPKVQLPEIYFFVSGFNRQIIQNKTLLGVGIDLYLGANYPIYKELTHEYLLPNMRKDMLVSNVLSTILHNRFSIDLEASLLDAMVYEGKMQFLLSVVMPDVIIENRIGFSTEALSWCDKNERNVWETILTNKHLFSNDPLLINQYINDAPFTSPISQSAPGRLGVWIGWQIVDSYMRNNKEVSLNDLMNSSSAKDILERSMYRPS